MFLASPLRPEFDKSTSCCSIARARCEIFGSAVREINRNSPARAWIAGQRTSAVRLMHSIFRSRLTRIERSISILDAIGNTTLVQLRNVVPGGCADVYVKLEPENPTGSMKDLMANDVISRAEADGRLQRGGTIIEYTGGSTGTSLALVAAAKGYAINIVTSDAFSLEKRDHMRALGAELTLVPSESGKTTKKLILDMIEKARDLSRAPNTYWTDQLNNHDSIAGYHPLGEEIWSQTAGRVDAFVHSVGTVASLRGVATVLRAHNPSVTITAVVPAESSVLSGGQPGPHKIEGVGIGYTPPLWDPSVVNDIIPVKTDDAKAMTRRLAREEALAPARYSRNARAVGASAGATPML
jgi:cysteine synthase A